MSKKERCPNCGKKGLIKGNLFIKDATHRCCYCDMEFKKGVRKGEQVWKGDTPEFGIEGADNTEMSKEIRMLNQDKPSNKRSKR